MKRQEWERVARKQLGVDPDATIPAPAPAAARGSVVVFLADGREIDITGKTAEEAFAEIGTATILRTVHTIPAGSILEGLTLEQLERLAASNRDRGIRISPELRAMLERRTREARS